MNSRSIHPIARWTLSLGLRRGRHLELSRCKSERPSFLGPVAPRRIICLDGTTAVPGSENTWSPGHPSRKPGLSLSPSSSHFQSSPNLATQPFNYFLTLFFLPHPHFSSPNSGHHRLLQGQFNSCLMGFSVCPLLFCCLPCSQLPQGRPLGPLCFLGPDPCPQLPAHL